MESFLFNCIFEVFI